MSELLIWWTDGGWLLLLAYCIGTLPCGLLVARFAKVQDPRTLGSGNFGATNMLRTTNKKLALITLVADMLKGAIPTLAGIYLFRLGYGRDTLPYLAMLFAVVGHCFPVWLKFRGGKGVATFLGGIAALPAGGFILIGATTWIIVALISRYSSLASLLSTITVTAYASYTVSIEVGLIFSVLSVLILWQHRSNILRLLRGEELRIKF